MIWPLILTQPYPFTSLFAKLSSFGYELKQLAYPQWRAALFSQVAVCWCVWPATVLVIAA